MLVFFLQSCEREHLENNAETLTERARQQCYMSTRLFMITFFMLLITTTSDANLITP